MIDHEPTEYHRAIAGRFTALTEGTTDWDAPAPVEGWTARDVVRHLVEWLPPFLAGGAGITLPMGPGADADPVAAWRTQAEAVQALLEDPATASAVLSNPHIGDVPLPEAISRFYTTDVFMHTWDLARATGQDETLDADLCAELHETMLPIDELLRTSGQYGPAIPPPPGADAQTLMLSFIGRRV